MYGSIQSKFWTNTDIQNLSDQSRLLAAYLLTSSHTTMLGCFRLPIGYIADDLKWSSDKVEKGFADLSIINFLTRDESSGWVMIHNFLKYHPIENPNQGTSIAKLFKEVPKNSSFIFRLVDNLSKFDKHFKDWFRNALGTLSKPFRNQEQDQEQKKEQDIFMSGKPDVDSICNKDFIFEEQPISPKHSALKLEALEVLQFLNEKTGKNYRDSDANMKLIMARLKSGATIWDCRQIIAKKTREWKGDVKMEKYLRPATLFNEIKFEQYIGELVEIKEDENANEPVYSLS